MHAESQTQTRKGFLNQCKTESHGNKLKSVASAGSVNLTRFHCLICKSHAWRVLRSVLSLWNGPLRHGRHGRGQAVGACGSLHRNLISEYSRGLTATLIRCVDCIMGVFFLQYLICRDLFAPWQTQFQTCAHDAACKTLACVLSTTTPTVCSSPLPLLSLFPYKKMLFYTSLVLSRPLNGSPIT